MGTQTGKGPKIEPPERREPAPVPQREHDPAPPRPSRELPRPSTDFPPRRENPPVEPPREA